MSYLDDLIRRVAAATKAPQAGVVICTEGNGTDAVFCIWAIGTNGRINSHKLNISCTDEARLQAHVEGFIENHCAEHQSWFVVRPAANAAQHLDRHFCIWVDTPAGEDDRFLTPAAAHKFAEGNAPAEDAWFVAAV